jgi:CDP-diacylglycerol--serine O-phosphatidyltransferase
LLVLYTMGLGSTQNRLRTALSYSALFSLLALSQGWLPQIFHADTVSWLLAINIALSAVVALYNMRVLQKRFVADALSFGNLSCGVLAMIAGSRGDYVISLALLLLGATLDGFDGAAARRWGSTRWGVYSDDVADGVNFGLAPGALLYFAIGGASGIVLGVSYSLFTISRLVFFTLDKEGSDPAYFAGVPSTVGGIITVCSVILFRHQPALLGMMVGLACAQMVSFDTAHKHLGRAIARHNKLLFALPAAVAALIATAVLAGPSVAVIIVLAASVLYAMVPVARSFKNVLRRREAS